MKFKAWVIEVILSDGRVTYANQGAGDGVHECPITYSKRPSFSYPYKGGYAYLNGDGFKVSEINVKQVNVEVTECQ